MPHETVVQLDDIEEFEPDPISNPVYKGFQSHITTSSGAIYELIEGQLSETGLQIDDDRRVVLAKRNGSPVLGVVMETAVGEADAEYIVEATLIFGGEHLEDPADTYDIVARLSSRFASSQPIIRRENITGLPQAEINNPHLLRKLGLIAYAEVASLSQEQSEEPLAA